MTKKIISQEHTRQWALKNGWFSKKVDSGYWSPHGEFLPVPNQVNRRFRDFSMDGGWAVGAHGKQVIIHDHHYHHDYKKSLAAAIAVLESMSDVMMRSRHAKRSGRHNATGVSNVSISYNRAGKYCYLSFRVNIAIGFRGTIYVGREDRITEAFYQAKLNEAIARRDELEEKWLATYTFGEGVQPHAA